MNSIKSFFKDRGLYLLCLALVFAATAAGIFAIRNIVRNVVDMTQREQHSLEGESTWNQPNALANEPAQDVPLPAITPPPASSSSAAPSAGASSSGASSTAGGAQGAGAAASAPSASPDASPAVSGPVEGGTVSVGFSGDELVYHETLGDWRTHNGADYAAAAGAAVRAVCGGTVAAVYDDALWGGVVEIADRDGRVWRYCGLDGADLERGETVSAGTKLGSLATPPAEADGGAHLHLECVRDGVYHDPTAQ